MANLISISRTIVLMVNFILLSVISSAQLPFIAQPVPPGVAVNSARMNDLAIDGNGNKWIAFAIYGAEMFDGVNWTMFSTSNSGIASDSVTAFAFDGADVWIGTKAGVSLKSGANFTNYNSSNSGLPSDIITEVFVDGSMKWFGTDRKSVV